MTEEGLRREIFRYLSNETTISEMTIQDHVDRIIEIIWEHAKEKGWMKLCYCPRFYEDCSIDDECPKGWKGDSCQENRPLTDEDFK